MLNCGPRPPWWRSNRHAMSAQPDNSEAKRARHPTHPSTAVRRAHRRKRRNTEGSRPANVRKRTEGSATHVKSRPVYSKRRATRAADRGSGHTPKPPARAALWQSASQADGRAKTVKPSARAQQIAQRDRRRQQGGRPAAGEAKLKVGTRPAKGAGRLQGLGAGQAERVRTQRHHIGSARLPGKAQACTLSAASQGPPHREADALPAKTKTMTQRGHVAARGREWAHAPQADHEGRPAVGHRARRAELH